MMPPDSSASVASALEACDVNYPVVVVVLLFQAHGNTGRTANEAKFHPFPRRSVSLTQEKVARNANYKIHLN